MNSDLAMGDVLLKRTGADTICRASMGWDAEKVNGRKRHIAVDTFGLITAIVVTAACVQDRQQ